MGVGGGLGSFIVNPFAAKQICFASLVPKCMPHAVAQVGPARSFRGGGVPGQLAKASR